MLEIDIIIAQIYLKLTNQYKKNGGQVILKSI